MWNKGTRMWVFFSFVSALGKKLLSSTPVRCLFLCLLDHHTCPPPTLVPFHLVYICLLKLVYFSFVYDTARVSGVPPCRALANAPTLSDYFATDSIHLMRYEGSHEISSNKIKKDVLTSQCWQTKTQWPSTELVLASYGALLDVKDRRYVWTWGTVRQSKL